MIGSRAECRRLYAGFVAAGLIGIALVAPSTAQTWRSAQADPRLAPRPLLLVPPPRQEAPPAPARPLTQGLQVLPQGLQVLPRTVPAAAPDRPGPDPLTQPSEISTKTAKSGEATVAAVRSGEIDNIDPQSSGPLDDTNGGLGIDLWQGTRRALVERLLPMLPTAPRSRVMRDLMRRLLLTAARAPEGQPADAAGPRNLLAQRLELLLAMGFVDEAARLMRVIPAPAMLGTLARTKVEILMLGADADGACSGAEDRIAESDDAYWPKLLIFCQAMANELDRAALGVELLRETGEDDRLFFSLIDALAGYGEVEVGDIAKASPLHLAMLVATDLPLPMALIDGNRPRVLRAVARRAEMSLERRLEAAQRAVAIAVLPPLELAQLYARVEFTEAQLNDPFGALEGLNDGTANALLFQAVSGQTVPTARAEVLKRLWAWAFDQGRYVTAVQVTAPLLQELQPAPELAWLAADAARSLYIAGFGAQARAWIELARRQAPVDPEAAKALTELWPLGRIADADETVSWDASLLEAWRDARLGAAGADSDGSPAAQVAALLTMLDALGEPIIGGDWEALYDANARSYLSMPPPWVWVGLRSAADRKLRGETLLFSLLSIGDGDLAGVSPVVLHRVIVSLRQVELDAEARALALEAAVAKGI